MFFVRIGPLQTVQPALSNHATPEDVLQVLQESGHLSECSEMGLVHGGSWLRTHDTLLEQGVGEHSTLSLARRMRGGQPVKVDMMTKHISGSSVIIDITPQTPIEEIKSKLEAATGIPAADQKIMLSGINQLVLGDKRTNIKFGSCGTADSLSFAISKPISK